jgi:hypothetical protein
VTTGFLDRLLGLTATPPRGAAPNLPAGPHTPPATGRGPRPGTGPPADPPSHLPGPRDSATPPRPAPTSRPDTELASAAPGPRPDAGPAPGQGTGSEHPAHGTRTSPAPRLHPDPADRTDHPNRARRADGDTSARSRALAAATVESLTPPPVTSPPAPAVSPGDGGPDAELRRRWASLATRLREDHPEPHPPRSPQAVSSSDAAESATPQNRTGTQPAVDPAPRTPPAADATTASTGGRRPERTRPHLHPVPEVHRTPPPAATPVELVVEDLEIVVISPQPPAPSATSTRTAGAGSPPPSGAFDLATRRFVGRR